MYTNSAFLIIQLIRLNAIILFTVAVSLRPYTFSKKRTIDYSLPKGSHFTETNYCLS